MRSSWLVYMRSSPFPTVSLGEAPLGTPRGGVCSVWGAESSTRKSIKRRNQ